MHIHSTITRGSYVDGFDRNGLLYLRANSPTFDHSDEGIEWFGAEPGDHIEVAIPAGAPFHKWNGTYRIINIEEPGYTLSFGEDDRLSVIESNPNLVQHYYQRLRLMLVDDGKPRVPGPDAVPITEVKEGEGDSMSIEEICRKHGIFD